MTLHTLNTWAVANLFHPLLVLLYFGFNDGEIITMDSFAFVFAGIFYSFLISIPSFLLAGLLLALIKHLPFDTTGKFLTWLLLVVAIPAINLFLLGFLFGEANILESDAQLFIPASISVVLSVIIRYKQFFKLFIQPQNQNHENTMV